MRSRSCFASTRLRMRYATGVTSSSSSSARNSTASSSERSRVPSSFAAMSEVLLAHDVHLEIAVADVLAHHHALVHLDPGTDEELAALLGLVEPECRRGP